MPMPPADELIIRPFADGDSIDALTELLHRAYGPLAEMGFNYFATHQTAEQTRKRIDGGHCAVAERGGRLVATVTWYDVARHKDTNCPPLYRRPGVAHFGQFAVEPALQRSGIGTRLVGHVEAAARSAGCTTLALDTAEGATHLVRWYERLGFRTVGHVHWNITNYRSVVMCKELGA